MPHRTVFACYLACLLLAAPSMSEPERFEAADSEGVVASREGNNVFLMIDADAKRPIKIPRLAAPLRSIYWAGQEAVGTVTLKPEPASWVINWKKRPEGAAKLVLRFDAPPLLLSEVGPIKAAGDGSFELPAHLATTRGNKIRYEPQPNKNTVGYWVDQADSAEWTIQLDKPGRFNVAVLQGCGRGQGGSTAWVRFNRWLDDEQAEPQEEAKLEFKVHETGHFQNFQWRQLGEVTLSQPGTIRIEVSPKAINKAALMDIRTIQLIRLPDRK